MTPGPAASRSQSKPAAAKPRLDQKRAPAARRRQRKPSPPPLFARRHWLRAIAILLGILVLLAHVFTLKPIATWLGWLHIDWPDIAKHCAMLSLFTLTYRLSWIDAVKSEMDWSTAAQAGLASILICSSWGALCETLQHWIPARDFSVWELAVNILTPLLIVGLIQLVNSGMLALRRASK
jgi:VanZ family protein